MALSLSGLVKAANGSPVANASVRLIGLEYQLAQVPSVVHAPSPDEISWTRKISGFSGHRWACWSEYLNDKIEGIGWNQFAQEVVDYNPHLITDKYVFQADKEYFIPEPVTKVVWQRPITGFTGNRWNAWERFVKGQVRGISWKSFMEEAVRQNPSLAQGKPIFRANQLYRLPEEITGTNIVWNRTLTGFSGSRWNCWQQHVKDQIEGLSWNEFVESVLVYNSPLTVTNYIFQPEQTYLLPNQQYMPQAYLFTWTDGSGRYRFTGLSQPGPYQVVVKTAHGAYHRSTLMVQNGVPYTIQLEAGSVEEQQRQQQAHQQQEQARQPQEQERRQQEQARLRQEQARRREEQARRREEQARLREKQARLREEQARRRQEQARLREEQARRREEQARRREEQARRREEQERQRRAEEAQRRAQTPPRIRRAGFVQTNGTKFSVNGQELRFIGVNIRGLLHYGDRNLLRYSHQSHANIQLRAAQEMGARVVRVFGANRHLGVEDTGNRLQRALDQVAAHDMYLLFSFTDVHHDTGFNVPGDGPFYQDNRLNKAWYEGGYKQHYLPFVEYLVKRFKDHPRIFAWELGNELKAWAPGVVLPELFIQFAKDVSNRIRQLDQSHLITTGVINSGNLGCSAEQAKRLYQLPNLDFMTAHVYYSQNNSNQWLELEAQRAESDVNLGHQLNMPFIIEEIGFEGGDRVRLTEQHLQKWFDQKRAAGFMQWGLMATNQDIGDGDNRFGIHGNHPDYRKVVKRFGNRAHRLYTAL